MAFETASKPKEPHPAMAFMSLLEDAGLVNIANRGSTFYDGMGHLAFPYLPDWMYHAIALMTGAYALMQLKVF